jgi:DNA-binding LytR/AlgR family response regulator
MRLLIADDEPPLRAWLAHLLSEAVPDAEIVAEVADGQSALDAIESLKPDAALLDIRMPGLSGLEVAARITVPCRVIFITAHDEFAVQAFEQAAVDYLLKPVTADRLITAINRLRTVPSTADQGALLQQLIAQLAAPESKPLRWLRAGNGDCVQLIDVLEVDRFEAADKYTTVHVGQHEHLIRSSLKELEQQLDPQLFWRVHRGTLVRVAAIREARRDAMGRLWIELHGGGARVAVSRSFAHLFRVM